MELNNRTRAKHWAGCTIPNYTEVDLAKFVANQDIMDYYCFGREVGAGGLKHLQAMFSFKKQTSLSAVKKLWNGHFEVMRGTFEQARNYCIKDGDFEEYGVLPLDQKVAGLAKIADKYADTISKAKSGNIEEIEPEHQLRYYRTIKAIAEDNRKAPPHLTHTRVNSPNFWIYGPTNTGKSHRAREIVGPDHYAKIAANKWWDKYKYEKTVLIEDIDKTHAYQGYYLKIWADKYAFPVEIKNGYISIRPEVIVVTSNYAIDEIFPPDVAGPLKQRFQVIHMNVPLTRERISELEREAKQRKRKYDGPLVKPALFRQDADGDIIVNNIRQHTVDQYMPPANHNGDIIISSDEEEDETSEDLLDEEVD